MIKKSFSMKYFFFLWVSLVSFPSISTFSQDDVVYPKEKANLFVSFGIEAYTSHEIVDFRELNKRKDYESIRRKLVEGTINEKMIVVVLLEHYQSNRLITLTDKETELINTVKKSTEIDYSLNYGCSVEHFEGTFADFFKKDNSNPQQENRAYNIIKQSVTNY